MLKVLLFSRKKKGLRFRLFRNKIFKRLRFFRLRNFSKLKTKRFRRRLKRIRKSRRYGPWKRFKRHKRFKRRLIRNRRRRRIYSLYRRKFIKNYYLSIFKVIYFVQRPFPRFSLFPRTLLFSKIKKIKSTYAVQFKFFKRFLALETQRLTQPSANRIKKLLPSLQFKHLLKKKDKKLKRKYFRTLRFKRRRFRHRRRFKRFRWRHFGWKYKPKRFKKHFKRFAFFRRKFRIVSKFSYFKKKAYKQRKQKFIKNVNSRLFRLFRISRLARLVRNGRRFTRILAKGFKSLGAIRIIKTYNNFFIALQTSLGQNLFAYSTGRVDLRRNRRLTKQALEIASLEFSKLLRRKKFLKLNINIVGRTTYHTRIFIRNLRQIKIKIRAINFVIRQSHNGLRIRASRRV